MVGHDDARRLGWLGTGRMGVEMGRRLLSAGCDLVVFNRSMEKAEPLLRLGAKPAGTAAELATRDIVFITVGSSDDLISAVLGPGGLMSGSGAAPAVLIDCSTVSAEASARVRAEIADRGTALLAAPVMGNPKVVRAGKMTAAVSGPRDAFVLAEPYLNMLGRGVTYVGDGEVARTVKLCHNLFLGVVAQSLAEITVLAEKSGISRQAFLDCLNKSVMGSLFTGYKTPAYVNLDFEPTFTATLLRKDFDLGLAAAREHEVPMPVAAVVHQLIQGLVGRGYGDSDFAALLQQQADSAGLRARQRARGGLRWARHQRHLIRDNPNEEEGGTGRETPPPLALQELPRPERGSRPVGRRSWRPAAAAVAVAAAAAPHRHQFQPEYQGTDHHRRVALPDRRLLRRRPGVPARLPAVGQRREREGRPARPPGHAQDSQRQQLTHAGADELPDPVRPGQGGPRLRAVLLAADHAVGIGRGEVRLRPRRGRGRSAVGLREPGQRVGSQRVRRQPADRRRDDSLRQLGRLAAAQPAAQDGGLPDGRRPVRRPAGPARPAEAAGARGEDGLLEDLPGRGRLLQAGGRPGGRHRRAGRGARIHRCADRGRVHAGVRAAALQPRRCSSARRARTRAPRSPPRWARATRPG